jgi:hypothetical protein
VERAKKFLIGIVPITAVVIATFQTRALGNMNCPSCGWGMIQTQASPVSNSAGGVEDTASSVQKISQAVLIDPTKNLYDAPKFENSSETSNAFHFNYAAYDPAFSRIFSAEHPEMVAPRSPQINWSYWNPYYQNSMYMPFRNSGFMGMNPYASAGFNPFRFSR